jgi:hypothetical protein
MASDFCLAALKGPIYWIDTCRAVMDTVVDIKMSIVGLKYNTDRTVDLARYKIKVCGFGKLINLKATPN